MLKAGRINNFLVCWITYVTAYLCRISLSSVLTKLEDSFNVTAGALGIVGTLFFATYAVGQLINGAIGDRISPYKFVAVAIAGTTVINLLVGLSSGFVALVVCWALNGFFQSMFWGPLMRILSESNSCEHNANISTGMTTSMITGYILSWALFGSLFINLSWRAYFLVPALCGTLSLIIWILFTRSAESKASAGGNCRRSLREIAETIVKEKLYTVVLICVCMGLVKESVSFWTPLILVKSFNFEIKSSLVYIMIIPLANFAGILLSRRLSMRFSGHIRTALLMLFSIAALGSLALFLLNGRSKVISLLLLAAISAITFGCNSILLSFVPLSYAKKNIVSTLVGIFDFSSYAGAAVSSFVLGRILTGDSWKAIPLIWFFASVAAMCLCGLKINRLRKGA